jgi:hypothetical protein
VTDTSNLPPTQYLLMETLAARCRLGESYWTFPNTCMPAARKLEEAGLITTREPGGYAFEASFTDAGRAVWLPDGYVAPTERPIARVRKLCEAARDGDRDLMRLTPSQVLAALDGRAS